MLIRYASLLAFTLSLVPVASAQAQATVTVIHGIPGGDIGADPTLPVDINVPGVGCPLTNVQFGDISERLTLPAGEYDLEVRLSTGDCTGGVAVSASMVPFEDGENATVIAHLDADGAPTLTKYTNEAGATEEGNGRVAVHHTAAAPAVDIVAYQFAEGDFIPVVILEGVTNPQSAAAEVPADFYSVSIAPAGDAAIALQSLAIPNAALTLVYAVGSLSTGSFQLIVDVQEVGSAETPATVTVIHGIEGSDLGADPALPVDVFVSGVGCVLTDFTFGTISPRLELPPGSYDIAVSFADGSCGGDVAISAPGVPFAAGENATVVAHLTEDGAPTASKFTNDVSEGVGRIAVHHTAAAGAVDITLFKRYFFWFREVLGLEGVTNGQSASQTVFPRTYIATIAAEGRRKPLFIGRVPVERNTAVFLYAVGTPSNGTFQVIVDSQSIE